MDDKFSTQISTTAWTAVVDGYYPPAPPGDKGADPLALLRSYPLIAGAWAAVVDGYYPPAAYAAAPRGTGGVPPEPPVSALRMRFA